MAIINKNTVIKNGIIMGFVKIPGHHIPEEFEICKVEKWGKMTDNEADDEARGSFYENGYSSDYDVEDLDWWY